MESFIERVFHFDSNDDLHGLHDFVVNLFNQSPGAVFLAMQQLLVRQRIRSAYVLALLLQRSGHRHTVVFLALASGAVLSGAHEEEQRWLAQLRESTDQQSTEQQMMIDQQLIPGVVLCLLNVALPKSNTPMILRVLELLKAAVPACRAVFDVMAPVPLFDLEAVRRQAQQQAELIQYPLPPEGMPRASRRVLVIYPHQRGQGMRMLQAMLNYGWQVEFREQTLKTLDECQQMVDVCHQTGVELLILHANGLSRLPEDREMYRQVRDQLKARNPNLILLGRISDKNENGEQRVMEAFCDFFDVVQSSGYRSEAVLKNERYMKKINSIITAQNGGFLHYPEKPLVPQLLFDASVHAGNWPRVFWLAVADQVDLPILKIINAFSYQDPLYVQSPMAYYERYMKNLANATCCFSVSLMSNQERIFNYRALEALLCGTLLVQEYAPEMHAYFIPGEHYLEFSTVAELRAIVKFITEHPDQAEEVRRRGHAFARANYSDEKLLGQLEKLLYYPDA